MAWIELHQSLPTHRKTLDLADELDITPVAAVGHLTCLWLWAIDNAADGSIAGIKPRTVGRAAMWDGNADDFIAALKHAGFLHDDGAIHDWHDYAGKLVDRRRANAERMREARSGSRAAHVSPISSGTSETRAAHVQRTWSTRAELQDPTVPDQTETQPVDPPGPEAVAPDAGAPDAPRPEQPELIGVALVPVAGPNRPPVPVPKTSQHPFADLWDALDGVVGEARTPTEKNRRAKACKELRQGRYTAADVTAAAEHWDNVMGDATMSDFGLTANMGKLLGGRQVHGRSNGLVTAHRQQVTEYASVNRTSGKAAADTWEPAAKRAVRR